MPGSCRAKNQTLMDLALGSEPLNTVQNQRDCDLLNGHQLVTLELGLKVKSSGSSTWTYIWHLEMFS